MFTASVQKADARTDIPSIHFHLPIKPDTNLLPIRNLYEGKLNPRVKLNCEKASLDFGEP